MKKLCNITPLLKSFGVAVLLALPMVALAAEETGEAGAESVIGISNLVLIVGIGAIIVIGFVVGVIRSTGEEDA